jgi:Cu+-exporting ATPase
MDTLVALGTWTAWGYSVWAAATASGATYFDSAAMITAVVALGRWLEARGTRDVLAGLERLPEPAAEAWRVSGASPGGRDAEPERVPTSELSAGEVVVVRAGERVPADGVLASGAGSVDAAQLTGEARLVELGAGEEVFAGAILLDGELVVRVTRVGPDTLWGRLAALAEDAAFARSSAERLADRVAAAFVPLVLAIAAVATLAALGYGLDVAVERGVSVLVIACPCALALAMPLASANAVAAARGLGVPIRGSEALDRARALATVLFDKTGTLTEGRLELEEVVPATAAAAALRLAAAAEGDAGGHAAQPGLVRPLHLGRPVARLHEAGRPEEGEGLTSGLVTSTACSSSPGVCCSSGGGCGNPPASGIGRRTGMC